MAGHQPIITLGFGSRGQLDLIDMQSMPDGAFKWIMNYTDHGIKLTKLKNAEGLHGFSTNSFALSVPHPFCKRTMGVSFMVLLLMVKQERSNLVMR